MSTAPSPFKPEIVVRTSGGARIAARKGIDGCTLLVCKQNGTPWDGKNPTAVRVLQFAGTDESIFAIGQSLISTHYRKDATKSSSWWGTWRIVGIVYRTGETVKVIDDVNAHDEHGDNPPIWPSMKYIAPVIESETPAEVKPETDSAEVKPEIEPTPESKPEIKPTPADPKGKNNK